MTSGPSWRGPLARWEGTRRPWLPSEPGRSVDARCGFASDLGEGVEHREHLLATLPEHRGDDGCDLGPPSCGDLTNQSSLKEGAGTPTSAREAASGVETRSSAPSSEVVMSMPCATAVITVLLLVPATGPSTPGRLGRSGTASGRYTGGSQLFWQAAESRPDFVRNNNYCTLQVKRLVPPC